MKTILNLKFCCNVGTGVSKTNIQTIHRTYSIPLERNKQIVDHGIMEIESGLKETNSGKKYLEKVGRRT
jgi:hypothetical protein